MRRLIWFALGCLLAATLSGCGHRSVPIATATSATTATVPIPAGATAITSVTTTPAATNALIQQARKNEAVIYQLVQHMSQSLVGQPLLTAIVGADPQLASELSLTPSAAYPRIGIGSSRAHNFVAISIVDRQAIILNKTY